MYIETAFYCHTIGRCMFFFSYFFNSLHKKECTPKYKRKCLCKGCFPILHKLTISVKYEKSSKLFL